MIFQLRKLKDLLMCLLLGIQQKIIKQGAKAFHSQVLMNQPEKQMQKQNWQMKTRSVYFHVPIFKMKLYEPLNDNNHKSNPYVFFHLPAVKKVVGYTSDLKTLLKTYRFNKDPNSFEIVNIENQNNCIRPYIVAGSTEGLIMCQPLSTQMQQPNETSKPQSFVLNNDINKNAQQIHINDILSLGNNKIVNCFNNGTISFWDLNQRRHLLSLPKTHSSYTYKLRKVEDRLISCANDRMAVVTDLVKMKKVASLPNPDSCWCAYPINYNVVTSVGLFNRVNIWDVRTRSLVQTALLENEESSFITAFNQNNLVLGDGNILKKCDMRMMTCAPFTSQNMMLSAQSIIVTSKGGYACGRRFQVCVFEGVDQVNPQVQVVNNIYNPFSQGDMFLYQTYFNQPNVQNQPEDQDDDFESDDEQEIDLLALEGQQLQEDLMQEEQQLIPFEELVQEQDEAQSTPILEEREVDNLQTQKSNQVELKRKQVEQNSDSNPLQDFQSNKEVQENSHQSSQGNM